MTRGVRSWRRRTRRRVRARAVRRRRALPASLAFFVPFPLCFRVVSGGVPGDRGAVVGAKTATTSESPSNLFRISYEFSGKWRGSVTEFSYICFVGRRGDFGGILPGRRGGPAAEETGGKGRRRRGGRGGRRGKRVTERGGQEGRDAAATDGRGDGGRRRPDGRGNDND